MKHDKIAPLVINIEAEGKKWTYRLTRSKPDIILHFEHQGVFKDNGTVEQAKRHAESFLGSAMESLKELPPELRRAALSDYGLIEKAEENARPEFLEGIGIMPRIRDNRVVCPTCNRVSNQRVTPDTEFEHLPFVCPHCNSGSYISYTGENVKLEEP